MYKDAYVLTSNALKATNNIYTPDGQNQLCLADAKPWWDGNSTIDYEEIPGFNGKGKHVTTEARMGQEMPGLGMRRQLSSEETFPVALLKQRDANIDRDGTDNWSLKDEEKFKDTKKKFGFTKESWEKFVVDFESGPYDPCFGRAFLCEAGPSREYWFRRKEKDNREPFVVIHIHYLKDEYLQSHPHNFRQIYEAITHVNVRWTLQVPDYPNDQFERPHYYNSKFDRHFADKGLCLTGAQKAVDGFKPPCIPDGSMGKDWICGF